MLLALRGADAHPSLQTASLSKDIAPVEASIQERARDPYPDIPVDIPNVCREGSVWQESVCARTFWRSTIASLATVATTCLETATGDEIVYFGRCGPHYHCQE